MLMILSLSFPASSSSLYKRNILIQYSSSHTLHQVLTHVLNLKLINATLILHQYMKYMIFYLSVAFSISQGAINHLP